MANGVGLGAFVNGMMQGQRFNQGNQEFEQKKRAFEADQALRDMRLQEARRAMAEQADFRSAMQPESAIQAPGGMAQPAPVPSNTQTQPIELGPFGTSNFDPARVMPVSPPYGQPAPQAQPAQALPGIGQPPSSDPLKKLQDAYLKETSYWLSKGKHSEAAAAYDKLSHVRDIGFMKSMSLADQQYAATKDPRAYLPAFNGMWDGSMTASVEQTGDAQRPWRVTMTDANGQAMALDPMDNAGVEKLIRDLRDPQARIKAQLARDEMVFKSGLKMREDAGKANVEGQWKVAEAAGKEGKITNEQMAKNAEIVGARAYLQSIGLTTMSDPRLNEADALGGGLTAQATNLRRKVQEAGQHFIGKTDPDHAQFSTGAGGQSQQRAMIGETGIPAAAVEALRQSPGRAPEFDAKYGAGASKRYLTPQVPQTDANLAQAIPDASRSAADIVAQTVSGDQEPVPITTAQQAFPGVTLQKEGAIEAGMKREKEKDARRQFNAKIKSMTSEDAKSFQKQFGPFLNPSQRLALTNRIIGATRPRID